LKIDTQFIEDHQARLVVEIDPEQLEANKRRAASKLASRLKIPGFRPGKAPYAVILRQVGEAAVMEEALELVVDAIYPQVIEQSGIHPYGPGRLDKVASMEPVTLEFVVPLEAEVTLGDYNSIRKPYEPPVVSDKDVEEVIENLRENQAVIEPVERPAQDGDLVTVRLSANRKQAEEDQELVLIREQSVPLIVKAMPVAADEETSHPEENEAEEWPFAGFSRHLVGMATGDEKIVEHQYPESESNDLLRGADAEFHLSVETVKSRQLPEMDDEFARSMGEFDTVEVLRDNVRKTLEAQASSSYNQEYDQQIIEEAIQQTTFKYPPQMLEREIDDVVEELKRRLERQKYDMDLYLKSREMNMEELRKELEPVAEQRLKHALFLLQFGKAEGVRVDPAELEQESKSTLEYLSRVLPEKEARRLSDQSTYQNLIGNLFVDMLSRRSMEHFRDICSGRLEQAALEQAEQESPAATVEQESPAAEIEAEIEAEVAVESQDTGPEDNQGPTPETAEAI
jgi:trigger factor